ncbi:MAG: AsnC family transcriptional regulator [Kangiella sp.]|nr:MAG: AsnC family transcriptional regulator [Kangiella sp.]
MKNELDKVDKRILDELQKQGRLSNVELSKRVHLSPSPCLDRVKRLEKEGYIKHYSAVLDHQKLGYDMVAYVTVTLDKTTHNSFKQFKEDIILVNEVIECDMVAGGFDYLLKLLIKNMKHYRNTLGVISEISSVSQTHTYMVIEKIKENADIQIL